VLFRGNVQGTRLDTRRRALWLSARARDFEILSRVVEIWRAVPGAGPGLAPEKGDA